jgi:hypothetical protein
LPALAAYRDGLAIARALAAKSPTDVRGQTDTALSLHKLASAGDDAQSNLTEALGILSGSMLPGHWRRIRKPGSPPSRRNSPRPGIDRSR